MSSHSAIFACSGVALTLGGRQILREVDLHVSRGEVLGLIGPNGAGKTSLFEVLSGRYRPEAGRVVMDGQDITGTDIVRRARLGLARTYQSPVVPAALTVAETFRAARLSHRPFQSRHRAEWAARLVNLTVPWTRPAGSLDTFDRRKLLLACLLMRRPKVLLMDEPASGLINTEIDELDLMLRMLVDEYHLGVVVIEHRLELLEALADRVTVLNLGEVIAEGAPGTVFDDPAVRAAYFEGAA
jgi:ABC-type branched-subunit amino acid transport system ATPase component